MKSLAEHLGVQDPQKPDQLVAPGPPPLQKMTVKSFCRDVLDSPQYRNSLLSRILLGELPPAVECLLYHYAYGKPVEKVQVEDVTPRQLEDWSIEQLEQRALVLLEYARRLRMNEAEGRGSDEDGPAQSSSVH